MAQDRHRIVFLMNGWASAAGGIQTFNRELACAVAKARSDVECIVVAPTSTESERADAFSRGVTLISEIAGSDWKTILLSKKIAEIPQEKVIAVVGHSYFSGEEAILLRERFFPNALGIHFIHMSPLHTESLKEYRRLSYVAEREIKVGQEISYASKAGLIFCVGPRLHRYMHDLLGAKGVDPEIIMEIDCGLSRPPERTRVKPIQPKLLCLGRTDSVGVKGIDIFAYAAGLLTDDWLKHPSTKNRPLPEFVARGAKEEPEKFENYLSTLAQEAGQKATIRARPYTSNRDELEADFRGSSIFVMPSREEGFGLVACEALSLGVPILVSAESGFAEVITRVAKDAHMYTDQCVIAMGGELPAIARRYADAALAILMDEDRWLGYFQALQERLLPVCSWESGARQFLTTLARFSPSIGGDAAVHLNGSPVVEAAVDPEDALQMHQGQLLAIPGVIGTGIKRAIVVFVEKGKKPNVPEVIGGIDVIISEVDSIRLSAGDGPAPGDGLLVNGRRIASIGAIVKDRASNFYALTVAHAVQEGVGQTLAIATGKRLIPAVIHMVDREKDIALLSLPDFKAGRAAPLGAGRSIYIPSPKIGAGVRLRLADGFVDGIISSVEMAAQIQTRDSSPQLYRGMFEVRLPNAVTPGISGAPLMDDRGTPVGIVVAAVQNTKGEMGQVLAKPIRATLRELELTLVASQEDTRELTVGVLATSEDSLRHLLGRMIDPVRMSRRGDAYFQGKFDLDGPTVIATPIPKIGNIGSAIVTTKLLNGFDLDYVMMLGTCGGLHPGSQHLGDVVVSSDILYYEPGSIGVGQNFRRTRIAGTTPSWLSGLASGIDIGGRPNETRPRIHIGSIASGEKVIRDASAFASTLGEWQSALAVEMEAAGMAEAVSASGRNVPFVVVRGIADFADESKDDSFREIAAVRAVDVGAGILRQLPSSEPEVA